MNFSKIDDFMEKMPERGIPACGVAVAKDGKVVYCRSVGYSDSAGIKPASNDDIYWIFSTTKVITCIAAMRLVEEGKIKLDDPVGKYIPEYASMTVKQKDGTLAPAKNEMKIIHLFTMTGGMTYDQNTPAVLESADRSTLGLVRAMAKSPLVFEAGTRYKYSLCHDVLGAVVEVASGMRFSEYLQSNIFEPLGVKDMGFHPTDELTPRFSAQYGFENGTARAVEREITNIHRISPEYDSGGAGLYASVGEYAKIIAAVANGGVAENGYVLLKPETVKSMGENRLCDDALNDFAQKRHFGYGWGLCGRAHISPIRSMSKTAVGEFGWAGAAGSYVMIDPEKRLGLFYVQHLFECQYAHVLHDRLRDLSCEAVEV